MGTRIRRRASAQAFRTYVFPPYFAVAIQSLLRQRMRCWRALFLIRITLKAILMETLLMPLTVSHDLRDRAISWTAKNLHHALPQEEGTFSVSLSRFLQPPFTSMGCVLCRSRHHCRG